MTDDLRKYLIKFDEKGVFSQAKTPEPIPSAPVPEKKSASSYERAEAILLKRLPKELGISSLAQLNIESAVPLKEEEVRQIHPCIFIGCPIAARFVVHERDTYICHRHRKALYKTLRLKRDDFRTYIPNTLLVPPEKRTHTENAKD